MMGSCYDEDSEEIEARIRVSFQDRGYFAVEIKGIHCKPTDPLGVPKPVVMEAEVSEGLRYRMAEISFVDNHAFSAEKLREAFPLRTGDLTERGKIAGGLDKVLKFYGTAGYLDVVLINKTQFGSNATVSLGIRVDEGPQYHMGKIAILATRELTARLLAQWKLTEGDVYDQAYLDRYIQANRDCSLRVSAGVTSPGLRTVQMLR